MDNTKILNPYTNRYVFANGEVGKDIISKYFLSEIDLIDEDINKISDNIIRIDRFELPLTRISAQGSSKIYNARLNGETYYIKDVVKTHNPKNKRENIHGVTDIELVINEFLASKIYRDVYGVNAIQLFIVVNNKTGDYPKYMLASKAIDIDTCAVTTQDCEFLLQNKIPGTIEPFLVDCILANWDVGARGNVGIVKTYSSKKAFRIDVGGSLMLRALGARRIYTNIPTEHETFFNPSNKGYRLFQNIKKSQIEKIFLIIENANIDKLYEINDSIKSFLNMLPSSDRRSGYSILDCINILYKRHMYYIQNKELIANYLLTKVL